MLGHSRLLQVGVPSVQISQQNESLSPYFPLQTITGETTFPPKSNIWVKFLLLILVLQQVDSKVGT